MTLVGPSSDVKFYVNEVSMDTVAQYVAWYYNYFRSVYIDVCALFVKFKAFTQLNNDCNRFCQCTICLKWKPSSSTENKGIETARSNSDTFLYLFKINRFSCFIYK